MGHCNPELAANLCFNNGDPCFNNNLSLVLQVTVRHQCRGSCYTTRLRIDAKATESGPFCFQQQWHQVVRQISGALSCLHAVSWVVWCVARISPIGFLQRSLTKCFRNLSAVMQLRQSFRTVVGRGRSDKTTGQPRQVMAAESL